MAWLDNHSLAEAECRTGWVYEDKVAAYLRREGLHVDQPPKSWRANVQERHAYVNELDLLVSGLRVSVKSRRVEFTCPDDIPRNRDPLFVDTVRKWGLRDPEPKAVVCISQVTDAMIWTSTHPDAKAAWDVQGAFDATRGYADAFLAAGRDLWSPIDTFVEVFRHVWDGVWQTKSGLVRVDRNRIVAEGTAQNLMFYAGTPFWRVALSASVRPTRVPCPATT